MQAKRSIETPSTSRLTIDLPESFVNRRLEVLVMVLDEDEPGPTASRKRRAPPPQFAGRVKEYGDVMGSIPLSDWGIE